MFFTAQRARAHSLFFIILLTSTSIGGAVAGAFVDSSAGWRGFWYFNAAMVASAFFVVLFFMPETAFYRSAASSRAVHGLKAAGQTEQAAEVAVDEKKDSASIMDTESLTIELVGKGQPSKHQKYGLLAGRDKTYSPLTALWRVVQTLTIWPVWICIGW
jgi:MFS family permease